MADEPEYADPQRYIELVGFDGTWRDLFWNRDFLALMARRLRLEDVGRALDVGCGAGHWGRALLPHLPSHATLAGVDREEAFLAMARESGDPARTQYVLGTAERLPFEDACFDLVTCQLVMIHIADPALALKEMRRVLRPGGVLLMAEPDNRAGNTALLGGEPRPSDDDFALLFELLLRAERGKLSLGEGDQSIGGRLPGLAAAAGLTEVVAYTNDRCMSFYPPYERGDMKVAMEQERSWHAQHVSVLCGSRADTLRFYEAGAGSRADFDRGWRAVERWMDSVQESIARGEYHAARGFVMYLVAGRNPE